MEPKVEYRKIKYECSICHLTIDSSNMYEEEVMKPSVRLDRTSQDYRDAKNHIYGLAHNVCLNGKEQQALLSAMGNAEMEMYRVGEDGKQIILTLMGIILDGLRFGNWPWTSLDAESVWNNMD
jgi:hypothetical protein